MRAIILAGGFGTRLQAVLPDTPKPMAPILDQPFLAYLLRYLHGQGILRVIFSVHYKKETIRAYFKTHYNGIDICYAEEDEPLGTGGAIVHALSTAQTEPVFVLNGDTFVKLNYHAMYAEHCRKGAGLTMVLQSVLDCSRYGKALVDQNVIVGFTEKGEKSPGLINAGVYLLDPLLFSHFTLPRQFSFEKDFLFPYLAMLKPQSVIAEDYFIDIGVPEDYERAKKELPA